MRQQTRIAKTIHNNSLVAILFATAVILATSLVATIMCSTAEAETSPEDVSGNVVVLDAQTAETVTQNLVALEESNSEMRHQLKEQNEIIENLIAQYTEEKSRADEATATADLEKRRADDAEKRASELQDQLDQMSPDTEPAPVNDDTTPTLTNGDIEPAPMDGDVANLTITQAEVGGWAARIDRYLEGTALDGCGQIFAQAACDYGVDPRLSPAIAMIESTAGAYIPAPHNAWGWGGPGNWASWPDWETAIREHTKGLLDNGYMPFDQAAGTRYCDSSYWSQLKPVIDDIGNA